MKMRFMMRHLVYICIFLLSCSSLTAQTTGYMGSMNYFTGGVDFQLTQDYPLYKFNAEDLSELGTVDPENAIPFLDFNTLRFTLNPWIEYNRVINRNMTLGLRYKYGAAGFLLEAPNPMDTTIIISGDTLQYPIVEYRTQHIAIPLKFNLRYKKNLVHAPLGFYLLFEPTFMFSTITREPAHELLESGESTSQVAFIVGVGENLILKDRLVLNFSAKSRIPLLDDLLQPDDFAERTVYKRVNKNHWLTAQLGIGFIF